MYWSAVFLQIPAESTLRKVAGVFETNQKSGITRSYLLPGLDGSEMGGTGSSRCEDLDEVLGVGPVVSISSDEARLGASIAGFPRSG